MNKLNIFANTLSKIELKYLQLYNESIDLKDFEKWVYANEDDIRTDKGAEIYEQLIILDYTDYQAKFELVKILTIDYSKLKFYELNLAFQKILKNNSITITDLNHNRESCIHDPYRRYFFGFTINGVKINMNNPFPLETSKYSSSNEIRSREFVNRFQKPRLFFEIIYTNLNCNKVRLVVNEKFKNLYNNDYTIAYFGKENEIIICIDKHKLIVNNTFISERMKKHWQ